MNESQSTPSGFLFVDKPVGPTSHDVVANVRRLLSEGDPPSLKLRGMTASTTTPEKSRGSKKKWVKVGHAGTLDPLASGLLILGIGKATKQLRELVGLDKTYEFTVRLGATSETDDAEGPIKPYAINHHPSAQDIENVLQTFIGEQEQIPPMHSAKKVAGTRLYKLARQGKTIERKPHHISVVALDLLSYDFPDLQLRVHCTSGTYVRSLARDIGEKLSTGGYVTNLRRTAIGSFSVAEAILTKNLASDFLKALREIRTERENPAP